MGGPTLHGQLSSSYSSPSCSNIFTVVATGRGPDGGGASSLRSAGRSTAKIAVVVRRGRRGGRNERHQRGAAPRKQHLFASARAAVRQASTSVTPGLVNERWAVWVWVYPENAPRRLGDVAMAEVGTTAPTK